MLSKCLQLTFNRNKTPLLKLKENGNATFPKTAQNVSFQASIYMSPKNNEKMSERQTKAGNPEPHHSHPALIKMLYRATDGGSKV